MAEHPSMGTDAGTYREPGVNDLRLRQMKHLRVDGVSFADMVPLLIEQGLIPEHHGNHIAKPVRAQGRRGDERNAQVCGHCEHLIHEQWKRAIVNLSTDEAILLEARWLWMNRAAKQIARYESLAVAPTITVTTVRKQIEAPEGSDQPDAYVVETTTREERKTSPHYFRMADELRANIARLAGVPVGDLSRVPTPAGSSRGKGKLVVYERTDDEQQRDEPAN